MSPGRKVTKDHLPDQESHGGEYASTSHGHKLTKIQENDGREHSVANPGRKLTKTHERDGGEHSMAIPGRKLTIGRDSLGGEHTVAIPGRKLTKGQDSHGGEHSTTIPGRKLTKTHESQGGEYPLPTPGRKLTRGQEIQGGENSVTTLGRRLTGQPSYLETHEHSFHVLKEMPSTIAQSASFTDAQQEKESRENIHIEPQPASQPVLTKVVPLYRCRQVLLKIGDNFLRVGNGNTPVISKLRPPLHPPNVDDEEIQLPVRRRRRRRRRRGDADHQNFSFQDFVFLADESATQKQSWYNTAKIFFNIRLGIRRPESKPDGSLTYLSAFQSPGTNHYEVRYDTDCTGCPWWTLIAVHRHSYVAHPLLCPDRCLMVGVLGLGLSPPLTRRDRARIAAGVWDTPKTLTVLPHPDFDVWCPAVIVE